MFAGHFGLASVARAMRHDAPLPLLVASACAPDLVRFALAPFTSASAMLTHSIPAVAVLAFIIGGSRAIAGGSRASVLALALVCLLHWPADVFTGCKPTTLHGSWIGFSRYWWPISDLLVELSLVWIGWLVCRSRGRARSWAYRWWVPTTATVLQLAFLANLYANSQFFLGRRVWTWRPHEGLLTFKRLAPKTMICRPS